MSTSGIAEHFFRHEYGQLVAALSRRVGVHHLEAVEDAVQAALMAALETWTRAGQPDNPSAWLNWVARNKLIEELRKGARRRRVLARVVEEKLPREPDVLLAGEVQDDLLRMLFMCCDDAIHVPCQLVLALKTLCGFGVREIALRLFTTEASVYKRLGRARSSLREATTPDALGADRVGSRLPAVHQILYLVFTEGHLSAHPELAIRRELCDEGIRLCTVLAEHPEGQAPETSALLALMHLHTARMGARQDASGGLLLLEQQDRGLWDRSQIQRGLVWLARSAQGDVHSRFHAEAGIAAEHCLAPSLEETRWQRVAESYARLERAAPSPLHRLNRAVAVAQWQGPAAGLAILEDAVPPSWLAGSYMWAAVLADLHRRCGHAEVAQHHGQLAIESVPSPALAELLERRLGMIKTG